MQTSNTPISELAILLVEQAPDALIFADQTGTIRVWNSAAEKIFGFSASQAIGENLNIIIPKALQEAHQRGFTRALAERSTKYAGQALPTKAVCADGTQIYVELSFATILDANDAAMGALAHARDITERYNKERAQRKRLQELENILASTDT